MKYIIIITLFLASCSKSKECYTCQDAKKVPFQVCGTDPRIDRIESTIDAFNKVGNITPNQFYSVGYNGQVLHCILKD